MINYAWVITKDIIGNGEHDGLSGPNGAWVPRATMEREGRRFKMFDDDGELYFEGFLLGGNGFEPLDDYGTPGAGCTRIEIES